MWGAIKKAINSDLTKPLDKLMKELQAEIKTKLDSISTSEKKIETVVAVLDNSNGQNRSFEITGKSGVLKSLSQNTYNGAEFNIYLDNERVYYLDRYFGVVQDSSESSERKALVFNLGLEFKNSVKIELPYGKKIVYLIQLKS